MSEMQTLEDLQKRLLKEIYEYARKYKIKYYSQMNKKDCRWPSFVPKQKSPVLVMKGVLEIFYDEGGYGFCAH